MKELLALILGLSILAFAYWQISPKVREWQPVEFEDVDKDELFRIMPEGTCWGVQICELQRSIFYCKNKKPLQIEIDCDETRNCKGKERCICLKLKED